VVPYVNNTLQEQASLAKPALRARAARLVPRRWPPLAAAGRLWPPLAADTADPLWSVVPCPRSSASASGCCRRSVGNIRTEPTRLRST